MVQSYDSTFLRHHELILQTSLLSTNAFLYEIPDFRAGHVMKGGSLTGVSYQSMADKWDILHCEVLRKVRIFF